MLRKLAVTMVAAIAMLAGSASAASAASATPDFGAQSRAAGLSAAQSQSLQKRVDSVLAAIPGGRQVSSTEVRYDGLTVTFDPRSDNNARSLAISCSYGYFCITVNGTAFSFYTCQTWNLSNWTGNAPYNNNQTRGTVARAYGSSGGQVWSSTAPASGTVNVTPWWSFKPC